MTETRVAIAADDIDWLIEMAEERLESVPADNGALLVATERLNRIKAGGVAPVVAEIATVTVVAMIDKSGTWQTVGVWRSERDAALVLLGLSTAEASTVWETVAVR